MFKQQNADDSARVVKGTVQPPANNEAEMEKLRVPKGFQQRDPKQFSLISLMAVTPKKEETGTLYAQDRTSDLDPPNKNKDNDKDKNPKALSVPEKVPDKSDPLKEALDTRRKELLDLGKEKERLEKLKDSLLTNPARLYLSEKNNELYDKCRSIETEIDKAFGEKKSCLAKDSQALEGAKKKYDKHGKDPIEWGLVLLLTSKDDRISNDHEYNLMQSYCKKFTEAREAFKASTEEISTFDRNFLRDAGIRQSVNSSKDDPWVSLGTLIRKVEAKLNEAEKAYILEKDKYERSPKKDAK